MQWEFVVYYDLQKHFFLFRKGVVRIQFLWFNLIVLW